MKRIRDLGLTISLLALLLAVASGLALAADGFDLSWHVVAGGGGPASAAGYQVDGTAGQAAAGLLRGGDYALGSGFWGGGEVAGADYRIHLPLLVRDR
jgi:hypothetical protein